MKLILLTGAILSSITACVAQAPFSTWNIGGKNISIVYASTTFQPGTPPPSQTDDGSLQLWTGLSDNTIEFETSIESWGVESDCGVTDPQTQWCLRTAYWNFTDGKLTQTAMTHVEANSSVTITYKRNIELYTWLQEVVIDGEQISAEVILYERIEGWWGINTDCEDCIGTIMPQVYTNTTIMLQTADPSFASTATLGKQSLGVTIEGLSTPDGGLTWNIEKITVPSMGGEYIPWDRK